MTIWGLLAMMIIVCTAFLFLSILLKFEMAFKHRHGLCIIYSLVTFARIITLPYEIIKNSFNNFYKKELKCPNIPSSTMMYRVFKAYFFYMGDFLDYLVKFSAKRESEREIESMKTVSSKKVETIHRMESREEIKYIRYGPYKRCFD